MGSGLVGDLGTGRTRRIEKVNCFSRSEDPRIVVVIQRVSILKLFAWRPKFTRQFSLLRSVSITPVGREIRWSGNT